MGRVQYLKFLALWRQVVACEQRQRARHNYQPQEEAWCCKLAHLSCHQEREGGHHQLEGGWYLSNRARSPWTPQEPTVLRGVQ